MDIPRGINAPGIEKRKLLELRYPNIEEAKVKLVNSFKEFHSYFASNLESKHMHPAFGLLDYREWSAFHDKHFKHHFGQFGVDW